MTGGRPSRRQTWTRRPDRWLRSAIAIYCIAAGVLMAGWWSGNLVRGTRSRGDRTHAELGLHLLAAFATDGWLIASGSVLLAAGA